jgi:large subunit ribosomal protein L15
MRLHDIRPARGAVKQAKRRGCGTGSGHGGTSTRGHKGQKSRAGSGAVVPPWFEGGQMPLQRRLPKKGFRAFDKKVYQIVNVGSLNDLGGVAELTPQVMYDKGLIAKKSEPVKVLGSGELKAALTVRAHAFSEKAKEAIEGAGGKAEIIGRA